MSAASGASSISGDGQSRARYATHVVPLLHVAVALMAAKTFVAVAAILLNRWDFPAELEWMEGGSLGHVARLARGLPLFTKPSPDWIPFLYHPLYYYVALVASWFLGLDLPTLRLVSLAGYAFTVYGLFRITWDATRSLSAAMLAPAFYAGTFELSGAWFDVGRVDGWAQGLFMLGLLAVRGPRLRDQLAAAACFFLCFMSKQSAVAMIAPVVVWALVRRGKNAWIASGALLFGGLVSVGWMQYTSDGWYWYYCVELPRSHPWQHHVWTSFWTTDLAKVWPAFVALVGSASFAVRRRLVAPSLGLAAATLIGGLTTSWFSRLHAGGFLNVLLPAFAAIGLALSVSVGHAWRLNRLFGSALLMLGFAQLWMLGFDPKPHRVTERDRIEAKQVQATVSAIAGDVYAPEANSYLIAAGKDPRPNAVAVADVLRGGRDAPRDDFLAALDAAVAAHRFTAVVMMDVNINGATLPTFEQQYFRAQELEGPSTRTGVITRVTGILRPR